MDILIDAGLVRVDRLESRAKVVQYVFHFLIIERINADIVVSRDCCPQAELIDSSVDRRCNDLLLYELFEVGHLLVPLKPKQRCSSGHGCPDFGPRSMGKTGVLVSFLDLLRDAIGCFGTSKRPQHLPRPYH